MTVHMLLQTVFTASSQHSEMLRQTVNLFFKALIIGLLLNIGLQHMPAGSENALRPPERLEQRQALEQQSGEKPVEFSVSVPK